jgi:glycosyltransferase involved in cell wall biosynthesis
MKLDAVMMICQPPNMAHRSPIFGDLPICIDARMLGGGGTGVASYSAALRETTIALTSRPMLLQADHGDDGRVRRTLGALRHVESRIVEQSVDTGRVLTARDLFRRAHIHFGLFRRPLAIVAPGPPGIMHWTYPLPIVMRGWANIYTVHDAIPLTHPDLTSINPRRHRAVLAALATVAVRFVTVSEAARREIVAATGGADDFVVDAGQAIDATPATTGQLPAGLRPDGYLLFCGAIEPRKNLTRLLDAYRRSGAALPLVIVGPDGWRAGPIAARIARTPGVLRLPFQDRETLRRLIAEARALLFPSLVEGFGLPVGEAMALGTAVLTSAGGALEEVAGDAALLVAPADVDALASAIGRLANDDALVLRLAKAGRVRAAAFTPDRFAERLTGIYRAIS